MDKFVNAGIWITRRCSLKCMYCNIPKKNVKELKLNEWTRAIDIIRELGVKRIVLLGGEVTEYEDLAGIVDYITNKSKLECSLTTNGFNNYEKIKELITNGFRNIAVSIDTLDVRTSISRHKCESSIGLVKRLEEDKLKDAINLKSYTVVSKRNIDTLEDFIKSMTQRGIKVYLLPYHWGNEGFFEHRKNSDQVAFTTDNDVEVYKRCIDSIVKLKREGYLIDNSEEYLLATKRHIKKLDWKCEGLSELRIDSDGSLLCCCDKKGEVSKKFSIFDLAYKDKVQEFLEMRAKDSSLCIGCLWPSSFESERVKKEAPQYLK